MFGSTAGLWEYPLSSRRGLSGGPAAGDSISLLWVSTGVGQVSPQCLQLWSLPVVTGVTGMSFPLGPEALPPSDQDLADARLGLHLAR